MEPEIIDLERANQTNRRKGVDMWKTPLKKM